MSDAVNGIEFLTKEEKEIIEDLAKLWTKITQTIGNDITREGDTKEAIILIHALQNMILAQAACRVYPTEYRLLGEILYE